jgi:hypothetical protein
MSENSKNNNTGKARFIILNLIRLALLLAIFLGFTNNRNLVLIGAIIGLFLTFLPTILKKIFKVKMPKEFDLVVIILIYGILFLGEVRGLYSQFWWWDVFLNLLATLALGFIGLTIVSYMYKMEKIDTSPYVIAFIVFSFVFSLAALWEVLEFIMDLVLGFELQKFSLQDTMSDLITAAVGSFISAILSFLYIKSGKTNLSSSIITSILEKHPKILGNKKGVTTINHVQELLKKGESHNLEFKSTLRKNLFTNEVDKRVEHATLKTVAAYMNSDGGTLLVGVNDKGELLGLDNDLFDNHDKLNLHFNQLVKDHIGKEFIPYVNSEVINIMDKHILKIDCKKCNRHVFLTHINGEEFYVRNGPSSIKLEGSNLINYIKNKFQ